MQVSVGQKLLAESGTTSPSHKAAFARGQVATQDWLKDHDIKVDPSLGVSVDQGAVTFKRDQTVLPAQHAGLAGHVRTRRRRPTRPTPRRSRRRRSVG